MQHCRCWLGCAKRLVAEDNRRIPTVQSNNQDLCSDDAKGYDRLCILLKVASEIPVDHNDDNFYEA